MSLDLESIYLDLHRHPELSFAEHRTAGIVAEALRGLGYEVTEGIGGTGVVGVLRSGPGPSILLRADMDALPVEEQTGLDYASTARATDRDGNDVPVMHACGHDSHVTCLLGAAERLAETRDEWRGTVTALFQPAEEAGGGARAMVADGLFDRIPKPDVVLGQHVMPAPAGVVGVHAGPAFAATDDLVVTMHGRGGHGSRPETTIDPILMAASTVTRLQGVVSREVAGTDTAVVSVGYLRAGSKINIIPSEAEFGINIRTYDEGVRARVLTAVRRVIEAEAEASGAPRPPEIVEGESFPVLYNDPDATARTAEALRAALGAERVIDLGPITGSEDVGELATAAGVPLVYWVFGGEDPQRFATAQANGTLETDIPSNHSPHFAPVIQPTLSVGVDALVAAARAWLA